MMTLLTLYRLGEKTLLEALDPYAKQHPKLLSEVSQDPEGFTSSKSGRLN